MKNLCTSWKSLKRSLRTILGRQRKTKEPLFRMKPKKNTKMMKSHICKTKNPHIRKMKKRHQLESKLAES